MQTLVNYCHLTLSDLRPGQARWPARLLKSACVHACARACSLACLPALICFALLCFALLCFALLCFALLACLHGCLFVRSVVRCGCGCGCRCGCGCVRACALRPVPRLRISNYVLDVATAPHLPVTVSRVEAVAHGHMAQDILCKLTRALKPRSEVTPVFWRSPWACLDSDQVRSSCRTSLEASCLEPSCCSNLRKPPERFSSPGQVAGAV